MSRSALAAVAVAVLLALVSGATALSLRRPPALLRKHGHVIPAQAAHTVVWKVRTSSRVYSNPLLWGTSVFVGAGNSMRCLHRSTGAVNWTVPTGGRVYGSPLVDLTRGTLFFGSNDGLFRAVSASTGRVRWTFNTSDLIVDRPAMYNGVVIFGCFDGNVFALNATTGAKLWNVTTQSFVSASAVVTTTSQGTPIAVIGSQDGNVYAINAATGAIIWQHLLEHAINYACAAVAGQAVFCSSKHGTTWALSTDDGSEQWMYRTTGSATARASLSADGSAIFFPANFNEMLAVSTAQGTLIWKFVYPGAYLNSAPVVFNGVVVFGTGASASTVVGITAATGALAWTYTGGNDGAVNTRPAIDNSMIVVGTQGGVIIALTN